ncbi:MAG TPA: FAD-dependent oxidoreductase [Verrucomicrobiae bacterium]|nr:FAD-dependent oxidoreductase [Verrucomicrobiae bacterium]
MSAKRVVIVGGVAGGASAAARVRRLCEKCEIIVFERGTHVSFANCGLPYFVGGEIVEQDSLLLQTPETLHARFNLDVRVRTEVLAIDRAVKTVKVRESATGREYEQPYDSLILSTGASPLRPPIPGIDRRGHFVVRNIPDVEQITAWIKDCPPREINRTEIAGNLEAHVSRGKACRAVVVGGGYIGLEMAEQLKHRGLGVTLVEALPQVMTPLDPEMAAWLHGELISNGVGLHLADPVAAFEAPKTGESARASVVVLKSGKRLEADTVILGLGVRPETSLAKNAGLKLGALGGIRVNERLQTSDPNIFAVGDAVEVRDRVTGAWSLIPLAGPANRQGRIAADNIFGRPSRYEGTWGTAILRLFNLAAGCTGANEKSLRKAGIPFQALHLHPGSHAGYYPGAEPIAMKILFAPDTGKLLGAQAVGHEGVDKRIDVLATALKAGMTMNNLAELELAYAPPFGSAKDPVNMAGMAAQNVLAGEIQLAQWNEIRPLTRPADTLSPSDGERAGVRGDFVLLDVRRPDERAKGFIPGSVHIPLDQIRARMGELPRDREIVTYCLTGQRSYFACRILAQNGFRARNLSGSYRTWKTAINSKRDWSVF